MATIKKAQTLSSPAMPCGRRRMDCRGGFTLIELIVAMNASLIVMTTTALLVHSGHRGWVKTFNSTNCESRLGALDTMVALGAVGRKSNKTDYRLYRITGDHYDRVLPLADPEEILIGQAIEFRYWDTDLDADLMDPAVTATAYALFYLDGSNLRADYGHYPPGGISVSGQRITGAGAMTVTLARNVSSVEFSHTAKNMLGDGRGCVRMKLVITDPADGAPKTTLSATLMRNVWPQ